MDQTELRAVLNAIANASAFLLERGKTSDFYKHAIHLNESTDVELLVYTTSASPDRDVLLTRAVNSLFELPVESRAAVSKAMNKVFRPLLLNEAE